MLGQKSTRPESNPPDGNRFIDLATGDTHACARTLEGTLVCWGNNGNGQSRVPGGSDWHGLNAASERTCALRADSSLECWGGFDGGSVVVPLAPPNRRPLSVEVEFLPKPEPTPPGTALARFTTRDLDPNDVHTYSLIPGEGDRDNGLFHIEGDTLFNDVELGAGPYLLRMRSDDGHYGWVERWFEVR